MKAKRIFAPLLAGIMTAALAVTPAMAAGATVDTTRTGSVTVYKYTDQNGNTVDGTGADKQTLPTGITALAGCTFAYYKIGDVVQLSSSAVKHGAEPVSTVEKTGLYFSALDSKFMALAVKLGVTITPTTVDGKTYYMPSDVEKATGEMIASSGDASARGETQVSNLVSANKAGAIITDAAGKASVSGLALGVYLFAETGYPDSVVVPDSPFLVQLPFTNVGGTAWEYDQYVYPKNQTLSVTKKIEAGKELDSDDYQIGETVKFRTTSDVPKLMGGKTNRHYIFTDTMSAGLTYNGDVTIKLGTTYASSDVLKPTTDYTVSLSGINGFSAVLTPAGLAKLDAVTSANYLFTDYSATVNQKALVKTANPNTMKVTFATSNTEDKEHSDTVNVYTYQMDLTKTFTDNDNGDYSSVVFNMKDGSNPVYATKVSDGVYTVAKSNAADSTSDLIVGAAGHLIVKGLDSRTYTLTEVKTAADESLLVKDLVLSITPLNPVNGAIKSAAVNGNALMDAVNLSNGIAAFTVANNPILTFLRTGGAGLTAIIAAGVAMLSAALVILIKKRKRV